MLSIRVIALGAVLAVKTGCPRPGPEDAADPESIETNATDPRRIALVETPADQLSNAALHHTELVRITRNFGKSHFQIALDAWTPVARSGEISDVRLWWARSDRAGERSPFSAKSREHLDLDYLQLAPDRWRVDLKSERKRFRFSIEFDETGKPAAYADLEDGSTIVRHCRVLGGTLGARKIFGAPIGIKSFDITCVDADGNEHAGRMLEHEGD